MALTEAVAEEFSALWLKPFPSNNSKIRVVGYLGGGAACYDPSYAPMLVAMLMTMLMAMFLAIAGRSSLGYRVVPKPTLFRVSLCSPEPYR